MESITIPNISKKFILEKNGYYVCRIGNVEATACLTKTIGQLETNAGFYGTDDKLEDFIKLYLDSLKNADINMMVVSCNSFRLVDRMLVNNNIYIPSIPYMEIPAPYLNIMQAIHDANEQLIIVSHFADEIEKQMKKLNYIWPQYKFKKDFIKVVKSYNTTYEKPHKDYFESLEDLKQRALDDGVKYYFVSCGAYGIPLCSHLKNNKKNVIYIGGILQILFGLMGSRWETRNEIRSLMNMHWMYPSNEKYNALMKIENGCYI